MKDTTILFRTDKQTKKKAQAIADQYGLSLSAILNAFLVQIVKENRLPLIFAGKAAAIEKQDILSFEYIQAAVRTLLKDFPKDEIKEIYLFGSYARGEATGKSDVDLLLIPGEKMNYFDVGGLNEDLREKLGRSVDTVVGENLDPKFAATIKKDQILIYEQR